MIFLKNLNNSFWLVLGIDIILLSEMNRRLSKYLIILYALFLSGIANMYSSPSASINDNGSIHQSELQSVSNFSFHSSDNHQNNYLFSDFIELENTEENEEEFSNHQKKESHKSVAAVFRPTNLLELKLSHKKDQNHNCQNFLSGTSLRIHVLYQVFII